MKEDYEAVALAKAEKRGPGAVARYHRDRKKGNERLESEKIRVDSEKEKKECESQFQQKVANYALVHGPPAASKKFDIAHSKVYYWTKRCKNKENKLRYAKFENASAVEDVTNNNITVENYMLDISVD